MILQIRDRLSRFMDFHELPWTPNTLLFASMKQIDMHHNFFWDP